MYVCLCKGLTESDVQRIAQAVGPESEALATALRLDDDDCCGRCARNIEDLAAIACSVCPISSGFPPSSRHLT
jgi:bacterioferritin-associated ferredoxin